VGRYLDIARKVANEGQKSPPASEDMPAESCAKSEISIKSPEQAHLLAAGWEPKVRCDRTIWESPRTGFWYSEEVALEMVRLDDGLP
jgi:hypothetical protein